jgi:hypothetical protein
MLMRCSAVRVWEASDRLIPKGQGKKVACSQTDKVSKFHHDDRHHGTAPCDRFVFCNAKRREWHL